jgi:hypothetical protein
MSKEIETSRVGTLIDVQVTIDARVRTGERYYHAGSLRNGREVKTVGILACADLARLVMIRHRLR